LTQTNRGTLALGISCVDFDFLTILGQGAYGQVHLVQYKKTKDKFALKVLGKDKILRYDKIDNVFRERDIASDLSGHPNIIKFEATFQDEQNLYFVLEYAQCGSLAGLLK
jgi:serine/threonine protein kinase